MLAATTLLIASALPMGASASVVFDSIGSPLDTSKLTSAWCSSCSNTYRVFDQFTLSSSESITGFSVALYSPSPYWGSGLTFSIWSVGSGNVPGTELFSQTFGNSDFTTSTLASTALIASTDNVSGLELLAGSYYVSFSNNNLAVWGYEGGGGNLYQQGIGYYQGTSAVFTLSADKNQIPEPAGLALFGLALACATVASRRRKG